MVQPYTHGTWIVKPGKEDDFIRAWKELAEWTKSNVPGAGTGRLLRDREQTNRFASFGPWESLEAISAWRQMPDFQQRIGKIRELLESFEPQTLELVAEV